MFPLQVPQVTSVSLLPFHPHWTSFHINWEVEFYVEERCDVKYLQNKLLDIVTIICVRAKESCLRPKRGS